MSVVSPVWWSQLKHGLPVLEIRAGFECHHYGLVGVLRVRFRQERVLGLESLHGFDLDSPATDHGIGIDTDRIDDARTSNALRSELLEHTQRHCYFDSTAVRNVQVPRKVLGPHPITNFDHAGFIGLSPCSPHLLLTLRKMVGTRSDPQNGVLYIFESYPCLSCVAIHAQRQRQRGTAICIATRPLRPSIGSWPYPSDSSESQHRQGHRCAELSS